MLSRLQQLSTDWKTYLGLLSGLGAAFAAFKEVFNKGSETFGWFQALPTEARWVAVALLSLIALILLVSSFGKRSILKRPDRFIISSDDPRHLVGRENEIIELHDECVSNSLVFLVGESGAGKSALVQAGLLPRCQIPAKSRRLFSILIDASNLSWADSIQSELTRLIASLTEEQRKELGCKQPLEDRDIFSWLMTLPPSAPQKLLVVIDQIDDYILVHRQHFQKGRKVVTASELEHANSDWKALAELIRQNKIHILLVCRNDAVLLDALRFKQATSYILARIDPQLVSPLLDRITEDDGKGETIINPEFGWKQLKDKLLRDLSAGSQVLPIQLVIALDTLRRLRFLTVGEYSKMGGIPSLERLYVNRHISTAASHFGIEVSAVLRGLTLLITEDGIKTKQVTKQEFAHEVFSQEKNHPKYEPLVEYLEARRILRRQYTKQGEHLKLYHDYLARGVREVYRHANRLTDLITVQGLLFSQALNCRQRLQTLLPLWAQSQMLWYWLRGKFKYGEYRFFAFYSTIRFVPIIALLAIATFAVWHFDKSKQELKAAEILAQISSEESIANAQGQVWKELSIARDYIRIHSLKLALTHPGIAAKIMTNAELYVHATIGLDLHGQMSDILFETAINTGLSNPDSTVFLASLAVINELRIKAVQVARITPVLVERMKIKMDSDEQRSLGEILSKLSSKLETKDFQPWACLLLECMKSELNSTVLNGLGEALGKLSSKLETKEILPLASMLVERMKTENNHIMMEILGKTLANMSSRLEPRDIQLLASALVELMKTVDSHYKLNSLGETIGRMSSKLDAMVIQPWASILVERIKTEKDPQALKSLGDSLYSLCSTLGASEIQSWAFVFVERMQTEKDWYALVILADLLSSLNSKLQSKDVQPGAAAIVERMKTEKEEFVLASLGAALGKLSSKLEVKLIKPWASALVERMETENDRYTLVGLGAALGSLSNSLETKDVQYWATAIVERMKTEKDSYVLASLGVALGRLSRRLGTKDVQPGAAAIVERMKTEKNSYVLASLGTALGSLSSRLEVADVQPGATALVERMKTEKESKGLVKMGAALGSLSSKLEVQDIQSGATTLINRVKRERDVKQLVSIVEVLDSLSSKLNVHDIQSTAITLVERINTQNEWNWMDLRDLTNVLYRLSSKLEAKEIQPWASTLVERMKTEKKNFLVLSILGELLGKLSSKLEAKDVQPWAFALVERMRTEKDTNILASLGSALGGLSSKLEAHDVQPGAAALLEHMKTVNENLGNLAHVWVSLDQIANHQNSAQVRIQRYIDLLRLPLMAKKHQQGSLLRGLERVIGNNFQGNLWNFMDWAEGDEGRKLQLKFISY